MVRFAFLFLVIQVIVGWSSAFQQCTRRSSSAFFLLATPSRRCVLTLSSCPVPLEFRRSMSSSSALLVSATMNDTLTYSPEIATASSSPTTTTTTTATIPKLLGPASGIGFLAASLAGKPHKYLHSLQKRNGGVENFIIRPNIVVLNDPAAIRDVLETYNLPKTPKVRLGYKSIFYGNNQHNKQRGNRNSSSSSSSSNSGGILAAPWNKWLQQRRMAAPALAESMIGRLAPKFHDVSVPWFEYLESMATMQTQQQQRQQVDMSAAFTAVTMDAIGTILLGKSFGMCQQQLLHLQHKQEQQGTTRSGAGAAEVPFAAALHRLTDEAVRQMVLPNWWLCRRPQGEGVQQARKVIDEYLEECIADRRRQLAAKLTHSSNSDNGGESSDSKTTTTDLLNILLEAEASAVMSHDEIKGQLLQFVFAGYDTLAPTLTYMLWEISQNPSLQKDLALEARRALPNGKYDFPRNANIVAHELPLLSKTFLETNRKHPAAAMGTSRSVGKQALIVGNGKTLLPPHSTVLLPPWTLHRNERLYPNPERFDPSRFDDHIVRDPYAFQPFSGGPRNCIGSRLARAEALSLFAPLLRRYEIHCASKKEPEDHFSLTRRPKKAVMFTLTPRPE